jgi:hypothetical protein
MAFALGLLRSQDVALKSVSTLELARTGLLEALRRSTVCLKLWHSSLFILQQNGGHERGCGWLVHVTAKPLETRNA